VSTGIDRRTLIIASATIGAASLIDACGGRHGAVGTQPSSSGEAVTSTTTPPATAAPVTSAAAANSDPTTPPTSTAPSTSTDAGLLIPAQYVNHGPGDVPSAAITFHLAGDRRLVVKLLDLLSERQLRVTVFAVGAWITANADLGHRVVDDGHELGNHTSHHRSMLDLTRDEVRAEIVDGGQALVPFIGSIGRWFRPSGTDVPNQVILDEAGRAGYPVSVGYDIDSRDYTEPGSAAVVGAVNAAMHPGAIVSMHFGHSDTITALPEILQNMAAELITPCTVTELIG
jgi:peptidoglycan/xylan/chitin deacetylase (PgdA/CDA1 family)